MNQSINYLLVNLSHQTLIISLCQTEPFKKAIHLSTSHPLLPYLVVQRSHTQTTWSCTALWRTQIPWAAGVGWASSASTRGCQWGARCLRCTPTVTGRRVPGRQTCPRCARPCAAERPQNNPCSAWWSPRRSLAQAWWSGQTAPHRLSARGGG